MSGRSELLFLVFFFQIPRRGVSVLSRLADQPRASGWEIPNGKWKGGGGRPTDVQSRSPGEVKLELC